LFASVSPFEGLVVLMRSLDTLPQLIVNGAATSTWQYLAEYKSAIQVTDVLSSDVRCYTSLQSGTSSTMSVKAGSTIGFTVSGNPSSLYHQGVVNVYMAKAPSGTDVSKWDGSGNVWFKIYEISAKTDGGNTITFPAENITQVNFPIPAQVPSGQYLIRIEHIALHVASTFGGAQLYIACAQVEVGGTGTPGPLVAFPGAYTGNVCRANFSAFHLLILASTLINIYWPIPTSYIQPGPAIWPASGSGGGSNPPASSSTTRASSTTSSTTSRASSTTKASSTTSGGGSTGGTVAQYGQCGGSGYSGPTACVSGTTCTVLNGKYRSTVLLLRCCCSNVIAAFYSQCI
ncbi:glycosyl hydrolase family 61-domain-containing protein, partial [Favolaschia claudopus]